MGASETAVFSCSAVYAGREGLAGGKIPWKILRKSPGTVGRPGCNAGTVLWLYLVYRKGLSLADIGIFVISVLTAFLVPYFYRNRPVGSCSLRRNLLVLFVLLILFFLVSVAFMR